MKSLIAAHPTLHADYTGGMVLTDRRMLLYAWWFENALTKYPEVKTYNLMPQGLSIPGMPAYSAQEFTQITRSSTPREVIANRIQAIISTAYSADFIAGEAARKQRITGSLAALTEEAAVLAAHAEQAEILSRRLIESYGSTVSNAAATGEGDTGTGAKIPGNMPSGNSSSGKTPDSIAHNNQKKTQDQEQHRARLMKELDSIDEHISQSFAKEFISVLFFNNNEKETDKTEGISQSIAATEKTYKRIRQLALQMHKICASAALGTAKS